MFIYCNHILFFIIMLGMKKIVIAAGGTGGHLLPAQQLAERLRGRAEVVFAGHGLGRNPFFERGHRFVDVPAEPIGRRFLRGLWAGFWRALKMLREEKPDVVVGFGSYHTVPILVASVCLGKKIVLFEANRTLGKVIRLFAPFAKNVGAQFPIVGTTLVEWLPWKECLKMDRRRAREEYGLDPEKKTVLVFGGSQGAGFLNEVVPKALQGLDVQVLHFGMEANPYQMKAVVKKYEVEMAKAYAAADVVICRSGAGTIAELIRYELPALLIPYRFAYGHQKHNGEYLVERGAAVMLLEEEATPERIREALFTTMELATRDSKEQNRISFEELVL
jgi:UDP-N-acetylglucosamine--N-acetylmuramyl-(pentapeptide) pyrophosphoryl-undecaprenol N-acetylglucosamine transferase